MGYYYPHLQHHYYVGDCWKAMVVVIADYVCAICKHYPGHLDDQPDFPWFRENQWFYSWLIAAAIYFLANPGLWFCKIQRTSWQVMAKI